MFTGTEYGSENWLPEQKMVIKNGYRNRTWPSNMVTGTESGHQIWLPEQNVAIKYGYRNKTWSSNMVTGTKPGHQIWLPEHFFLAELKLSRPHLNAMRQFL